MKFVLISSARSSASREARERLQHTQLLVPEERRIRRGVNGELRSRQRELEDLPGTRVGRCCFPIGAHDATLFVAEVDRIRPDDLGHRPQHPLRDLFLARGEGDQIAHRTLEPFLLGPSPEQSNDPRRHEREQEGQRGDDCKYLADQGGHRIVLARHHSGEQRHGQQRRGQRQQPHPPARHTRLAAPGPPEPGRGNRGQHRPVDQEADQIEDDSGRAMLAGPGKPRDRESPDDHRHRHQAQRPLQPRGRAPKHGREPVQEVREKEQDGDVDLLQEPLAEAVRVVGDDLAQDNDEAERSEASSGPSRRALASKAPLVDRGDRERRIGDETDVAENLDR